MEGWEGEEEGGREGWEGRGGEARSFVPPFSEPKLRPCSTDCNANFDGYRLRGLVSAKGGI